MCHRTRKNHWTKTLVRIIGVLPFHSPRVEATKMSYFRYNVFVPDEGHVNSISIIIPQLKGILVELLREDAK